MANANPGEDTITLTPGLQIAAHTCPPISNSLDGNVAAVVTDSLIIEGNGGALTGRLNWLNRNGVQSFTSCPEKTPDTQIINTRSA